MSVIDSNLFPPRPALISFLYSVRSANQRHSCDSKFMITNNNSQDDAETSRHRNNIIDNNSHTIQIHRVNQLTHGANLLDNKAIHQDCSSSSGDSHGPIKMPWFGLDIGGSLVKVVFFDPTHDCKQDTHEERVALDKARVYLNSSKAYGMTGKRDEHLMMPKCVINGRQGTLHFIRFCTNQMPEFIKMIKRKGLADMISRVCATGGGAHKFENVIKDDLGVRLTKTDELDSVIYGIHYIDKFNPSKECYYIRDAMDEKRCERIHYKLVGYPYLVVNIGSGVSILAVHSPSSYSRIWGSSIGGGTFEGLCCLLMRRQVTFDEAIQLAEAGCSTRVDKLVKDIYGGDYAKFNLSGDLVASSFGNMTLTERRHQATPEDMARGVLELVTLNIASIARLCASLQAIDRVVFIGNFLRVNELSLKLLSYAVDYWSNGDMKALFLEHEGYFGAVGCLVESSQSNGSPPTWPDATIGAGPRADQ